MVFNYVLTIAYSRPVSASLDFHHLCTFPQTVKVIHPKYYKHLKKCAHQAIWTDKKWAGFWQISLYIK